MSEFTRYALALIALRCVSPLWCQMSEPAVPQLPQVQQPVEIQRPVEIQKPAETQQPIEIQKPIEVQQSHQIQQPPQVQVQPQVQISGGSGNPPEAEREASECKTRYFACSDPCEPLSSVFDEGGYSQCIRIRCGDVEKSCIEILVEMLREKHAHER